MLEIVVLLVALMLTALVLAGSVAVAMVVVSSSQRRGRMGINVRPTDCPRCETSLPAARLPKNARQAFWGGWTCGTCGAELDKWGRELEGSEALP